MDFQGALEMVYKSLDVVNSLRSAEDAIAPSADLNLVGDGGRLDSLALVTMILAIERQIGEATGQEVSLLDDDEAELQLNALQTPRAIASLILEKLASDEDPGHLRLQR